MWTDPIKRQHEAAPLATTPTLRRVGYVGLVVTGLLTLMVTFTKPDTNLVIRLLRRTSRASLEFLHAPSLFTSPAGFNFFMNIFMFVPLGVFFGLILGKGRLWLAMVLLPLLSAMIEGAQYFLPWRGTQAADFVGNSLGAWLGVALAWALIGLVDRPSRRRVSSS